MFLIHYIAFMPKIPIYIMALLFVRIPESLSARIRNRHVALEDQNPSASSEFTLKASYHRDERGKPTEEILWSLGEDGSFKALHALPDEAVFRQKPSVNVGCRSCDCSFLGQHGYASPCDIEVHSRAGVAKWLPAKSSVLEVGARHGSNSCAIAAKQNNSGKLVSLDADQDAWESLEKNRLTHGCNFNIVHGLLGKADGRIIKSGFGTFATPEAYTGSQAGFDETIRVPHFTLDDLQRHHSIQFDAAVFDCEGCFAVVMKEFPELASQLQTLIVESHNDEEQHTVNELVQQGWHLVDSFSRQRVLLRGQSESSTAEPRQL